MKVAVAVIRDEHNRVLIAQRPLHASHGGFWEFPGGKLEADETAEQALIREVKEEIGVEVMEHQLLGEVHHQYPNKAVHLIVFYVTKFLGIPSCLEQQINMKWIEKQCLTPTDFPEANHKVLELIPV